MNIRPLLCLLTLLALTGCANLPAGETPIEQAQRRMPKEMPVMVVDGCVYRRNLTSFNHYIVEDSRVLAEEGAKEMIAAFKEKQVAINQFVVPVMCATNMPPRGDDKDGRVARNQDTEGNVEKKIFPLPMNDATAKDPVLFAAYTKLFEPCDSKAVRKDKLFDCPLLSPEQATLLKTRLKSPYAVALSVAGDRASGAHRTGMVVFGLLLGFINIPGDEGTARVRVVSLDTGALIYSSFPGEFTGQSPADIYYDVGGGRSRYEDLKINKNWEKRMIKALFAKQR